MATEIEGIRRSDRRKYLQCLHLKTLFWDLVLMNGSIGTIKRTVIESKYISPLLAAEFYLIFISRSLLLKKRQMIVVSTEAHKCHLKCKYCVNFLFFSQLNSLSKGVIPEQVLLSGFRVYPSQQSQRWDAPLLTQTCWQPWVPRAHTFTATKGIDREVFQSSQRTGTGINHSCLQKYILHCLLDQWQ